MDVDFIFDLLELVIDIVIAFAESSSDDTIDTGSSNVWNNTNRAQGSSMPINKSMSNPDFFLRPLPEEPSKRKDVAKTQSQGKPKRDAFQPIEFEVLMLVYMLQQDDGMLTKDEIRIIKRHIRPHRVRLTSQQFQDIKQLSTKELSIDTLIQMKHDYMISKGELKRVFKSLEQVNAVTRRHDRIIDFMRNMLSEDQDPFAAHDIG